MNEIIQLPELLTLVSYTFLCVITVWVVSHGVEIFRGGNRALTLEVTAACNKLDNLGCRLGEHVTDVKLRFKTWARELVDEVRSQKDIDLAANCLLSSVSSFNSEKRAKRLAEKIRKPGDRKEAARLLLKGISDRLEGVPDKGIQDLLAAIDQGRANGPGEDIAAWFEQEGIDPLVIKNIIEQAGSEQATGKPGEGSTFLSREGSEYNWRLGTAASIAPLAGMAPTMSGTMEFLGDYSSSIQAGSNELPLSGLNTALVTTWWGCCLAIVSTILLSYVLKHRIPRARAMLREIENPVNSACDRWGAALRRASRIGQWGGSHV